MTTPAQGMEFFDFKGMEAIDLRNKNGYGYAIVPPMEEALAPELYFKHDAEMVLDSVLTNSNCLIEGSVGAGKTHLLEDVNSLIRWGAPAVATMIFSAHKNVGTKKGVKRALDTFESFIAETGEEGVIIIDNVDMYGYSGSKGRRQYTLAHAHIDVASYLQEVIQDDGDTPLVIGTSHDSQWREQHWKYAEKKGDKDEVTPVAAALLTSFTMKYTFDGKLEPNQALEILTDQKSFSSEEAKEVIIALENCPQGCTHRVVSRLDRENVLTSGVNMEIARIDEHTAALTHGIGLSKSSQIV